MVSYFGCALRYGSLFFTLYGFRTDFLPTSFKGAEKVFCILEVEIEL